MWKHSSRQRLRRNIPRMRKYLSLLLCPKNRLIYPRFIGEETYSSGSSKEYLITSAPTWCVDPLDGTVNYTHLFPMFCVSIAFILDGQATVGVIYQPILDVTYSALSGHGAWQDDGHAWKKRRALPLIVSETVLSWRIFY